MKFRVKHISGLGYFAQVKHGLFSGWKTIGQHSSGYGLYREDHTDYPLDSEHDAIARCRTYEQWFVLSKSDPAYKGVSATF